MKNVLYFCIFASAVLGCKKESLFDKNGFYGQGKAQLNGLPWTGTTGIFVAKEFCALTDPCYAIKITYLNQAGFLRGDLTFDFVPMKTGKHTINYSWPAWQDVQYKLTYAEFTDDGDVISGGYHVFEQNDDNFINLTEVNLQTGDVQGNFQAVVVRDSLWTATGSAPDTIRITDGSFYGKIFRE